MTSKPSSICERISLGVKTPRRETHFRRWKPRHQAAQGAKDAVDQKQALKELRKQEAEAVSPTTIGDLIKAQMENQG
jgi:hypothetical protein